MTHIVLKAIQKWAAQEALKHGHGSTYKRHLLALADAAERVARCH